jgi:protein-S-isoprenylcysteine O-methyltransferase Ste14
MTYQPSSAPAPAEPAAAVPGRRAWLGLVYAAVVYLGFLAVLGYGIGFFAQVGVPKGIDDGGRDSVLRASLIDAGLLALFAVQHSVMARPWFKRAWTRLVPVPLERATYVLCASLLQAAVFWGWRPIPGTVWHATGIGAAVLLTGYLVGWLIAIGSTFMIDHADLFGLRQAWLAARGIPYTPPAFSERSLYRWIRHPLMAGFVIAFWSGPSMSVGHLLFAAGATGYIVLGIALEEHDLHQHLGQAYTAYRSRVPALLPFSRTRRRPRTGGAGAAVRPRHIPDGCAERRQGADPSTFKPINGGDHG